MQANDERRRRLRLHLGWIACSLSTIVASFWMFWGVLENFHEGWYYSGILPNLGLMIVQFLSPAILFVSLAAIALRWPWAGAVLHVTVAVALAAFFFHPLNSVSLGLCVAMAVLGLLYLVGRPAPLEHAYLLLIGLPLLVGIGFAVEPAIRIAGRHTGSDPHLRIVQASDDTRLVWAPRGPGWPNQSTDWDEAVRLCRYLRKDGLSLAGTPQDIWRLPTVEEAVRAQTRHGVNAGGVWDGRTRQAHYLTMPDKEPPLWDSYSSIIYYWTQTAPERDRAFAIAFNGRVPLHRKRFPLAESFRAVRDCTPEELSPSRPAQHAR